MIHFNLTNCLSTKISGSGIKKDELLKTMKKFEGLQGSLKKKKNSAFLQLPFSKKEEVEALEKETLGLRKKFEYILFIGIGGSSLGAMALQKSLQPFPGKKPSFFFLDNPDSDYLLHYLEKINIKKTLLVPISKSGNTIESLAIFALFYQKLKQRLGKKAREHVIAITEKNDGTLAQISKKEGFKLYEVPKDVGGRFSVFSAVGLLPAALMGIKIQKLLDGAKKTEAETAYILALLQYLFYKKKKEITVFFPYGRKLEGISDWYIQLLAESIGKSSKVGPTPLKAIGAIDQHSQLQLFMDGPNNKFFLFLEVLKEPKLAIPQMFEQYEPYNYLKKRDFHQLLLTEKKAVSEALATKNRPNITLSLNKVDEEHIGELLFLLELQVAYLGELFQINAFDQPGVELGKKLTKKYLQYDQ